MVVNYKIILRFNLFAFHQLNTADYIKVVTPFLVTLTSQPNLVFLLSANLPPLLHVERRRDAEYC